MAVTLEDLVKQLADSSIVAPAMLENFVPPKAQTKSADELIAQLVKENHLTRFQAAQVKAGKAKALVLGEYTILDKIGAGGMGQVFKAQHRRMKRLVAIKMLPPAMTKDAQALARFEREVEAAAKLRHPNIVAADDAGQANGVHFLVMEYVDGKDLSATVKKDGPLPVNKAVNYILQAARGLEFAHKKGVVHRDIKPANLLLDSEGVVKILDMGLARIEQADGGAAAELTGTGMVMGTVDYMSPEQALNTKNADARADIYSLGISLYYLLSGKPAYAGETAMEKLMAHQNQPIPSLQDVQTTVPKELDAIFKQMVAKAPGNRYQSMSEVIEALESLGYTGSSGTSKTESAGSFSLSSADRKKLTSPGTKTKLGSLTQAVASEKSRNFIFKIVGGAFGTIIAPILVFYLIRHLEKEDKPAPQPAAQPAANVAENGRAGGVGTERSLVPLAGPNTSDIPKSPTVTTPTVATPTVTADARGLTPPARLVAPFDAAQAKAGQDAWAKHLGTQVETTNSIGMRMTLIPPGEFLMGSSDEDITLALKIAEEAKLDSSGIYRIQEERPQHRVRITQPFRLAAHEVTTGQFAKFVEQTKYKTQAEEFGGNSGIVKPEEVKPDSLKTNWRTPGPPVTDDLPVTQVSWNDAVAFCNWLSGQEQLTPCYQRDGDSWTLAPKANGYRLPTEAEWEYACRAGTATQFWFGDNWQDHDKFGWSKNAGDWHHEVGLLPANPFGLYDMHGNLLEWCNDWYDGKWYEKSPKDDPTGPSSALQRVLRGGSWYVRPGECRSSSRASHIPSNRSLYRGFRPALSSVGAQSSTASVATAYTPVVTPPPVAKPTGPAPPLAKAPFDAAQAKAHQDAWAKHLGTQVETINSVGQKMVLIPPGEFLMGSTDEQVEAALKVAEGTKADDATKGRIEKAERPQHKVLITKPLLMSATEVTIGQFKKFAAATGYQTEAEKADAAAKAAPPTVEAGQPPPKPIQTYLNPGYVGSDDLPAAFITWNDAVAYCKWLSEQEERTYRLPTEAEWEYACRAGTTTQYSFGDDYNELPKYDWHNKNAGGKTHAVGTLLPNPFGLFDMHGNLYEWCGDYYDEKWYSTSPPNGPSVGSYRVVRGGYWNHFAFGCRSASRYYGAPSTPYYNLGFRCVSELGIPATASATNPFAPGTVVTPKPTPTGPQPPPATAPFDAAEAKAHQAAWAKHLGTQVETVNSVGQKMVLIPPGEFLMGSTDEQVEAALKAADEIKADNGVTGRIEKAERPQHKVAITKPLLMSATEVTVGQFKKFATAAGYQTEAEKAEAAAKAAPPPVEAGQPPPKTIQTYLNPGYVVSDDSPAAVITWNDAVAYCKWLTEQEKAAYRLPTEAEWEYACRAGTTTQYSFGDDYHELPKYSWHSKNAGGKSHPVSTLLPNNFGLLDMHGNLYEWCSDYFNENWFSTSSSQDPAGPPVGSERVIRGGNWYFDASSCRSASRNSTVPSARYHFSGFRCVAELGLPATASATPVLAIPKKLAYLDPAFQQWVADTQKLPAQQQLEAVSKKLVELNPGFDGKVGRDVSDEGTTLLQATGTPKIENGIVTEFALVSDLVTDISPVRVFAGLANLICRGNGARSRFSDLSPLEGMKLRGLYCPGNEPLRDLSPLRGMPLERLSTNGCSVVDLSPLAGMPLDTLACQSHLVQDLSPLENCKALRFLSVASAKVTAAQVAGLQKALPNCTIEWDGNASASPAGEGAKAPTPASVPPK